MSEFTDKVVVITGASEGIGRALARRLGREKAKLVLAARNEGRLRELQAEVEAAGANALVVAADVSQAEDCRRIVDEAVARFGGIDVFINNAGITMWANFADTEDVALYDKVLDVNLRSVIYCTHYALPHLIKSKGRLAAVSSVSGFLAVPGHAVYGATKHAIHGFYDSLRLEIEDTGVTVTIIAPDFIQTEIHFRGLDAKGQPMGKRLGSDIAMDADTCAGIVAKAVEKRQRLVITSPRGRAAYPFRGLIPTVLDKLAKRSTSKHKLV